MNQWRSHALSFTCSSVTPTQHASTSHKLILISRRQKRRRLGSKSSWEYKSNSDSSIYSHRHPVSRWVSVRVFVKIDGSWNSCFSLSTWRLLDGQRSDKLLLAHTRSHGVMVSTLDSESSDPSSNLGGTFLPFFSSMCSFWELTLASETTSWAYFYPNFFSLFACISCFYCCCCCCSPSFSAMTKFHWSILVF